MTQQDSPKIARRRDREKRTISQMVALYCADNHDAAARTETAHCGEAVCPGCASIDAGPRMLKKHPLAAIRHLLGK